MTKKPRPRGPYGSTVTEAQRRRTFVLRLSTDDCAVIDRARGGMARSSWLRATWQREAIEPQPLDPGLMRPGDWRTRVAVTLSDEERATYEAAAERAGLELSTWLRAVGLRAATKRTRA